MFILVIQIYNACLLNNVFRTALAVVILIQRMPFTAGLIQSAAATAFQLMEMIVVHRYAVVVRNGSFLSAFVTGCVAIVVVYVLARLAGRDPDNERDKQTDG